MSRAKPAPIPAGILKLFLRMGSSAGTGHAGYASRSTDGVPGIDVAGVRVLLLTA